MNKKHKGGFLKKFLSLGAILFALSFSGCGSSGGGGGGGEAAIQQGKFIDSVVIGLSYQTPTSSGITDGNGIFEYRSGEVVQFFIGDILIGETLGKEIVTPVDLVSGATDETHPHVVNLIRFLQTLDDDQDPSNGILIDVLVRNAAAGRSVNFTLSVVDFESNTEIQLVIADLTVVLGSARVMVSSLGAQLHFRGALLDLFSGTYRGTFSGDDTGTWEFTINSLGIITGTSVSDTFGSEPVFGSIGSNGQANVSGTAGSSTFAGTFQTDGTVTGTWQDDDGESGTFTGSRVSSSEPGPALPASGSLTISGPDTNAIGTGFIPNEPTDVNLNEGGGSVQWTHNVIDLGIPEGKEIVIAVGFLSNGTVTGVGIGAGVFGLVDGILFSSGYGYGVICSEVGADCSGISVDSSEKKVTFLNASIPKSGSSVDNSATGPIVLNGTLGW
ncbi:MAG: hypothetical protein VST69_05995 [Nitrospirota bacterium]|nr:hypothetical protein [Nitrospirota bacterium]